MKAKEEAEKLRELLSKISKLASEGSDDEERKLSTEDLENAAICTPKYVPERLLERAARNAVEINVFNQPEVGALMQFGGIEVTPAFISLITTKYWGTNQSVLSVQFLDTNSSSLKKLILEHMNAWDCGIRFTSTNSTGDVRVARTPGRGYYSYLGTDCRMIRPEMQTMNLDSITEQTSDAELRRVIRHETGHTLGFPHEHMRRELVGRIDRNKAIAHFGRSPNNWSPSTVDQQVMTPLDERTLLGTPADETSIMCYQLPGTITKDGRPILGGVDLNSWDRQFASAVYPKSSSAPEAQLEATTAVEDDGIE